MNGEDYTIRAANAEDKPGILKMIEELQDEEMRLHISRRKGSEVAADYYDFLRNYDSDIFVATLGNEIVGFASGWIENEDNIILTQDWQNFGWISDICVDRNHAGHGIGRKLIKEISRTFYAKGARHIRLQALYTNEKAKAFYEKIGLVPYEISYEIQLENAE